MGEERSRTYSWSDPLGLVAEAAGRSGLEIMRSLVAGELPPPPIADTLGFTLVEAEHGRAVFECEPAEYHYNPIGVVHAGLAVTLLDSAMGCAFVTTLDAGVRWTTLEVKANFTRALTAETGLVRCTGARSSIRVGPSRRPRRGSRTRRVACTRTARARSSSFARRARRYAASTSASRPPRFAA